MQKFFLYHVGLFDKVGMNIQENNAKDIADKEKSLKDKVYLTFYN